MTSHIWVQWRPRRNRPTLLAFVECAPHQIKRMSSAHTGSKDEALKCWRLEADIEALARHPLSDSERPFGTSVALERYALAA